jgi:hypothetical protein
MQDTQYTETGKLQSKPIGKYLIEAGLVTSDQVATALQEQKHDPRRLGEILAAHNWVEQQTIEYLMEKVVLPEREQNSNRHLSRTATREPQPESSIALNPLISTSRGLELDLLPKKTFRFLLTVVGALILLSLFGSFSLHFLPDYPLRNKLAWLFFVDTEKNVPALYSSCSLLFCSVLLAIITYLSKVKRKRYVFYWGALSALFFYLFWDEAVGLHETLNETFSGVGSKGVFFFAWVIPASIFVIICGLVFLRFLLHLPKKIRRLFLIAASLYIGGALGIEILSAYYADVTGMFLNVTEPFLPSFPYMLLATMEELFEMLGIAVFVYALLSYVSSYLHVDLLVRFTDNTKQRHMLQ